MSLDVGLENKILYIFLDESGDLNFSASSTQYFSLGAIYLIRPFESIKEITELKYDLWETGIEFEYFHATEDKQTTRDSMFNILLGNVGKFWFRSIIVEKRKTNPTLQKDKGLFYQKILDILLRYIITGKRQSYKKIIIVTDLIPIEQNRRAIVGAIKKSMTDLSIAHGGSYSIFHFQSKSDINLQIVDYLNWAVSIKWERNETRSYDIIKQFVLSEYDVFRNGRTRYY